MYFELKLYNVKFYYIKNIIYHNQIIYKLKTFYTTIRKYFKQNYFSTSLHKTEHKESRKFIISSKYSSLVS